MQGGGGPGQNFGNPGYGGQAFGGAGGQSLDSAQPDSPEYVVKEFYDKLMADDLPGAKDLFSAKARGKSKSFREGKASARMAEEYKSAIENAHVSMTKQIQRTHIVVLEQGDPAAGGNAPMGARKTKGKPKGKKTQFKVVEEGGKFVIQDITIH